MSKNKKSDNKKSKHQIRTTFIVVIFLSTLAAASIYYGIKHDIFKLKGFERTINLPTIDVKVKSASSGDDFYLSADIVLMLERSKNEEYTDIYKTVQEAITRLDYDRVSNEDFTYMKETIRDALSDIVREEAGMNIYITDFHSSKDPIIREYDDPRKARLPVIK